MTKKPKTMYLPKRHFSAKHIGIIIVVAAIFGFLFYSSAKEVSLPTEKQMERMNDKEKAFVNSTLNKITANTTKEELIKSWGQPTSDTFGSKLEWWISFSEGERSRIVIYFSKGKLNQIRFDGGPGSYYWVRDVK